MLLDCDRMPRWTLASAARTSLLHGRARGPGSGALDPAWNARDDEAIGADARDHFDAAHQPWRRSRACLSTKSRR
jgi:hypothetical protein